jgi:hypothetical protein
MPVESWHLVLLAACIVVIIYLAEGILNRSPLLHCKQGPLGSRGSRVDQYTHYPQLPSQPDLQSATVWMLCESCSVKAFHAPKYGSPTRSPYCLCEPRCESIVMYDVPLHIQAPCHISHACKWEKKAFAKEQLAVLAFPLRCGPNAPSVACSIAVSRVYSAILIVIGFASHGGFFEPSLSL